MLPVGCSGTTDSMKALLLVTATLPEPSTAWMNHSTLVPRAAPRHSSAASCATSRSTAKPAVVVTPRLRPPCFRALWVRRPQVREPERERDQAPRLLGQEKEPSEGLQPAVAARDSSPRPFARR